MKNLTRRKVDVFVLVSSSLTSPLFVPRKGEVNESVTPRSYKATRQLSLPGELDHRLASAPAQPGLV